MKSSIHDCIEWSRETGADGKTSKRLGVVIGIDLAGLTVRVLKRSKTLENDEHPAYVELTELIVTVSNDFFNSIVCILILYDDLFVDKRVKHLPGAVEIFCIEHSPVTEMFSSAFSRFGLSTPPRMTRTFIGFTFDALANGAMESSSALSAHLFGAVPFAEAVKRGLRNAETVGSVYQASTRVHPAFAAKLLRLFLSSRNQDQFQYGMRKGVGSTLSMELDRAVKSKRSETVVSITFTGPDAKSVLSGALGVAFSYSLGRGVVVDATGVSVNQQSGFHLLFAGNQAGIIEYRLTSGDHCRSLSLVGHCP
jgi:hypothetical protein